MTDAYRLGPVLDARDREERIKRGDLAAAVDGVRATAEHVAAAATRVTAARAALANARTTPAEATMLVAHAHSLTRAASYVARRRRDLEAALDAHTRAEASHRGRVGEADQARDRLARARADHEVIARHFERWREQAKKLAERRAE